MLRFGATGVRANVEYGRAGVHSKSCPDPFVLYFAGTILCFWENCQTCVGMAIIGVGIT